MKSAGASHGLMLEDRGQTDPPGEDRGEQGDAETDQRAAPKAD